MLKGPFALVTGACGGIGRAVAIALGEAGAICEDIRRVSKGAAVGIPLQADCSNEESVKSMFNKIKAVGDIDILVNNAGIKRDKLALKMSTADFSDVLNTNLMSVFHCTKGAISSNMLRNRRGRIINISSVVGQIGNVGQTNYSAAKAGIIGYTKSCAKEFGSRGICINAVCPGFIKTPMTKDNEEHIDLSHIPLGRLGTSEEVAGLVRYLAIDPSAAYITGHCFNIDGGLGIGST